MSALEKLLEGVEVEYKPLGEVSTIKRGKRVTKRQLSAEKKYPVYSGGVKPMGYFDEYNQDENTITIVKYGTAGFVNFIKEKFWANDVCYCVKPLEGVNNKYLLHVLRQKQNYINSLATDAIPAHLPTDEINSLKIPIPCPDNPEKSLKIQKEIVRILDTFTELTAELTARKKQYEYYREKLLTFDESEVQHLPMGDKNIGEFIRGGGLQKKDFAGSGVGCIHYGQIYTHYGTYAKNTKSFVSNDFAKKARIAKYGDLVIATTSENDEDLCKAVAWLGDEDIAVSGDACFYRHNLNPKYVTYFFQTEQFHKQKRSFITGAKVRRVNASNLEKIKIPIPSLKEQQRIVNILDKFDTLTTSISEGLPKEIDLRKKQYEYYREKLLTFPTLEKIAKK